MKHKPKRIRTADVLVANYLSEPAPRPRYAAHESAKRAYHHGLHFDFRTHLLLAQRLPQLAWERLKHEDVTPAVISEAEKVIDLTDRKTRDFIDKYNWELWHNCRSCWEIFDNERHAYLAGTCGASPCEPRSLPPQSSAGGAHAVTTVSLTERSPATSARSPPPSEACHAPTTDAIHSSVSQCRQPSFMPPAAARASPNQPRPSSSLEYLLNSDQSGPGFEIQRIRASRDYALAAHPLTSPNDSIQIRPASTTPYQSQGAAVGLESGHRSQAQTVRDLPPGPDTDGILNRRADPFQALASPLGACSLPGSLPSYPMDAYPSPAALRQSAVLNVALHAPSSHDNTGWARVLSNPAYPAYYDGHPDQVRRHILPTALESLCPRTRTEILPLALDDEQEGWKIVGLQRVYVHAAFGRFADAILQGELSRTDVFVPVIMGHDIRITLYTSLEPEAVRRLFPTASLRGERHCLRRNDLSDRSDRCISGRCRVSGSSFGLRRQNFPMYGTELEEEVRKGVENNEVLTDREGGSDV